MIYDNIKEGRYANSEPYMYYAVCGAKGDPSKYIAKRIEIRNIFLTEIEEEYKEKLNLISLNQKKHIFNKAWNQNYDDSQGSLNLVANEYILLLAIITDEEC